MRYIITVILTALLGSTVSWGADILVFREQGKEFSSVTEMLKRDLGRYSLADIEVDKNYTYEMMRSAILEAKPKSLILLDNKAIKFARQLRGETDPFLAKMKGVAAMGLNLKKQLKDDSQFCGVAYEVPGYTLLTNFRRIYKKPLENVLVIYRKSLFQQEIEDAQKQLAIEKIQLKAIDAEATGSSEDSIMEALDKNLVEELSGQKFDAIWVVADSGLLTPKTFSRFWLARSQSLRIPFLCGIRQFAEPRLNFCSYAASPKSDGIAGQIVNMTFSLIEDQEEPGDLGVDYLLSTEKVVNLKKLQDLKLPVEPEGDAEVVKLE